MPRSSGAMEGDAGLPPERGRSLSELESWLRQPDAVLEPDILDQLRLYVLARGTPQQAVEFLTEGYQGYGSMASLVVSWRRSLEELVEGEGEGKAVRSAGDLDGSGSDPTSDSSRASTSAPGDEASYLRELVLERFDPDTLARSLASSGVRAVGKPGSGPASQPNPAQASSYPPWLAPFVGDPANRRLIYALSARHPRCAFLSRALELVLRRPGSERELAVQFGAQAASRFGVFHRLLATRLLAAAGAAAEQALERAGAELARAAGGALHCYVYARCVLVALARERGGARFQRLALELEARAAREHGAVVYRLVPWLEERRTRGEKRGRGSEAEGENLEAKGRKLEAKPELTCPPDGSEALQAFLEASAGAGAGCAEALHRLHGLWMGEEGQACFLEDLCHPRSVDALVRVLFRGPPPPPADVTRQASQLLALAQTEGSRRAQGAPTDLPNSTDPPAERLCAGSPRPDPAGARPCFAQALGLASRLACRVAENRPIPVLETERGVAALEACPLAAYGFLLALEEASRKPLPWTRTPCPPSPEGLLRARQAHAGNGQGPPPTPPPPLLALLQACTGRHACLQPLALRVLAQALDSLGPRLNPALSRALLDLVVALLARGCVGPVLAWARGWAPAAEPALARHWCWRALAATAPPYDSSFAAGLLQVLHAAGVERGGPPERDGLLEDFAGGTACLQFEPALPLPLAHYLQALLQPRGGF